MRWTKRTNRLALSVSMLLAGGTVFQGNCANVLFSLPICGGVLTFCTPTDQLNILFPLLETPDFNSDPTCTIPLGCGDDDNFFDLPDGFNPPGGGLPDPPEDESDGIGGGGGGGGGGV